MFTASDLRSQGFDGFMTWAAFDPRTVPDVGGVYVVLYPADTMPSFENVSCGGHFKGRDPSVARGQLQAKWVSGTETVYIGRATSLRTRLRQYRAFGAGKPVGHWGGRYIWQLTNPMQLRVCCKQADGIGATEESAMLQSFVQQYGTLPFANLRN